MKVLTALFAAALLAGCSTSFVNQQTADAVPAKRIYKPSMVLSSAAAPAGMATVFFSRDAGFLGSGCSDDLYVNNVKVLTLEQGEGVSLKLNPGSYFFRVDTVNAICPEGSMSQNAELKPGEYQGYRILRGSNFSRSLSRFQ